MLSPPAIRRDSPIVTTKDTENTKVEFDPLSRRVIGCAIEVHRTLGPGLLESAYRQCLAHELSLEQIAFRMEVPLPVRYKETLLDCGYRIDLFVESDLILELKSVETILPIHHAQLLSYMKLAEVPVGLLINFNVTKLQNGINASSLNLFVPFASFVVKN